MDCGCGNLLFFSSSNVPDLKRLRHDSTTGSSFSAPAENDILCGVSFLEKGGVIVYIEFLDELIKRCGSNSLLLNLAEFKSDF
ncbi:uncharacterized protein RAG0_12326 [Rhynchosporium agropyri]|uniref:Uncharacterized protein n=1 Tax=Rhynchosporium agropyri TaxID=914238 RepID=A0A1E1L813_9HELO|nr:uncharacterized protein RAG0_12326 [Rhynchosporium agropyri]